MYNLRYHLASLVSVFLALAIGVVLGGLIVDNSSAFDTDRIIRDLQAEYDQLRGENDALTARSEALESLAAMLSTSVHKSALSGKTIGVLSTDRAVSDHSVEVVRSAGGSAVTIVVDSKALDLTDAPSDLVAALTAAGVDPNLGIEAVGRGLADEWSSSVATATPITAALIDAGVLDIDGLDGAGAPMLSLSGLVNTASAEGGADPLALEIAVAFAKLDLPAVGASMIGGEGVVAVATWKAGVPSVTTMGSSLGQVSLVALLSGAEPGLYGLVDGATAPYVSLPQAGQP